jgi:hypothetical protein
LDHWEAIVIASPLWSAPEDSARGRDRRQAIKQLLLFRCSALFLLSLFDLPLKLAAAQRD